MEDDDDVRVLRERRPNAGNRAELLQLMERTRDERRLWIQSKSPTVTDILQKYPRFQDIDAAVSFFGCDTRLCCATNDTSCCSDWGYRGGNPTAVQFTHVLYINS